MTSRSAEHLSEITAFSTRARGRCLVVVLPALNESATIRQVLERIPRHIDGIDAIQTVVVDDGSTDDTAELAEAAGAVVVRHPHNLGVGAAFASGLDEALGLGADVIVNMDADGQFRPEDIPALIDPILRKGYGFVTCTRFADAGKVPEMPWIKIWGNRMMCRLVNAITQGPKFTDVSCGFRAYSRETALRLNLFGSFTYTQETFIDLAAKRVAMTEVPLVVRGVREHGKSRVASNLLRYALNASAIILRAFRDWRPLTFFGGIALVFLLIGTAMVSFVGCWWLATSRTAPWTSLITLGATNVVLGIVFGVLALVADQIGRVRSIQERLLYLQRVRQFENATNVRPPNVAVDDELVSPNDKASKQHC
ncbi:MAG: glycosyltransferase family 2 protein [Pirellulales bacterium]|nr:glycosyltransferase family 2 protein [Pirellulales bacterium]